MQTLLSSPGVAAQIQWIDVDLIDDHPQNPRLYIREDVVDAIASSVKVKGFDPCYAVLARPMPNGRYQMISGHHRKRGCIQGGQEKIAAWVREMDDDEAFMELVRGNNQGELKPLEIGIHALDFIEECSGGRGFKGGLSEYARQLGKESGRTKFSAYKEAATVYKKLVTHVTGFEGRRLFDRANHLHQISKASEDDWEWLVVSLLDEDWNVKQAESAVKAIAGLAVDPRLEEWLDPQQYKNQAVSEAIAGSKSDIVERVNRWNDTAIECLDSLEDSRPVWLFSEEGEPYREIISPKSLFLQRLPDIGHPSDKKILNIKKQVLAYLEELDREYDDWQERQQSEEAARKAAEAEARRLVELKERFTPDGILSDIRDIEIEPDSIDAIITDPPYLLSDGGFTLRSGKEANVDKNFDDAESLAVTPEEWVPLAASWLKPGGILIATCTLHIYERLFQAAKQAGLETEREQAIWYKRNSPPQLTPDRLQPDFEYIFLAFKPGDEHYFGYDDYKQKYDAQPSRTFDIPQCSGKERLGWHDTQKPAELAEKLTLLYVPPDGVVLDMFAGSGTFTAAAKKLGRRSIWVESKPDFFAKAENRIAEVPFSWEVEQ